MKSSLLVGSAFATTALADVCNHDNVLRCLLTSSAVASPYCSSYISIPVVTTTVSTYTPVTTTTTIVTVLSTYTSTSTSVSQTKTTLPTVYVGKRDTTAVYNHETNPLPGYPAITARAVAAAATSPAPPCLYQISSTIYPDSRISSACSCISVSTSTKSVTATASTSTSTVTSLTSTTASTTLLTVTTTTATIQPTATCTVVSGGSHKYTRYYKGSGFTENHNNPGNPGDSSSRPPVTTNYPATQDICTVAINCAAYAITLPEVYFSYDLHFLTSQNLWECVLFYNVNSDPGYFNVPNGDVSVGVGYYIIS